MLKKYKILKKWLNYFLTIIEISYFDKNKQNSRKPLIKEYRYHHKNHR